MYRRCNTKCTESRNIILLTKFIVCLRLVHNPQISIILYFILKYNTLSVYDDIMNLLGHRCNEMKNI